MPFFGQAPSSGDSEKEKMNNIFRSTLEFFRNNIQYLVLLSAPFIVLAIPSYFVSQPAESRGAYVIILGMIIYVIGISIFMSSLIFFLSQKYQGKAQSVQSNLINGIVYAPLLVLTLLIANSPFIAAAAIMFNSVPLYFLTLPLILLGIYVSLKSTFAPFHLILEGDNPLESIKSSFVSTKGKLSSIIMVLIAFYVTTTLVEVASTFNTNIELFNLLMFSIGVAINMLIVAFQQIAVFTIYLSVFEKKEI